MNNQTSMNRRNFFQTVVGLTGLALLTPKAGGLFTQAFAEEKRRGAPSAGTPAAGGGKDLDLPLVEPGKDLAVGVNYALKHSDIKDAKLKVERQGVAFDKQSCSSCGFYAKVGNKAGAEVGKCTIFAGKLVQSTAWCATWNKKA